jgi:hypothetical protein
MYKKYMCETVQDSISDGFFGDENRLDEPEHVALLRLTKLVEHLFRVPVAYMALLKADLGVSSRIGSGDRHWDNLGTFPQGACISAPVLWPGSSGTPVRGFDPGEIQFAAAAPLRTSDGLQLGALVIADVIPRPEFQQRDLEALSELASVMAATMELRLMTHMAREATWTVGDYLPDETCAG